MIKRETENKVRVCCGKKGCPTVEKLDEVVRIQDAKSFVGELELCESFRLQEGQGAFLLVLAT